MRFFSKGGLHPSERVSKSHLTGADWAHSSAVEHYLDMVGVTGSIPVAPTTRLRVFRQKLTLCVIISQAGNLPTSIVVYGNLPRSVENPWSVFWRVPLYHSPYNHPAAAPIRLVQVTMPQHRISIALGCRGTAPDIYLSQAAAGGSPALFRY